MSEEQVKENEQVKNTAPVNKKLSKTDLMAALEHDFATSVNRIYVNSLGKEVGFREITVQEQKTLSRVMIDNEKRKDIVFDAQCALVNKACLEPGEFDIYNCSEFDRLKLLIALYQANMYKNDVKFTCPQCGAENQYKLDFDNVLHKLDKIELKDETYNYENKNWKYEFKLRYPSVRTVSDFHKANIGKYRNANNARTIKSVDSISNIDYINLFIESIKLQNKVSGTEKDIVMSDYAVKDIEEIMAVFPQDVLYSDDGVLQYIANNYIKKINDTFEEHTCYNCGEKYSNDINSAESFL